MMVMMMQFREGEETRLMVDENHEMDASSSSTSGPLCQCRICHEEEEVESTSMEAPCACSGTLKYAHRGCIQRWCDEKGDTVCEICLQKFEPGYTLPPKVSQLIDVVVTIRGSLEVPRLNYQPPSPDSEDELDYDQPECSPSSGRGVFRCRTVVLIAAMMLVFKHLVSLITSGANHYAFTLATVFLLRATGIILPFYVAMRIIAAIQRSQWRHRRRMQLHERDVSISQGEEEEADTQQHTIEIHP